MKIAKHHYQIAGLALVVTLLIVGIYRLFFRTKAWEKMASKLRTPDNRMSGNVSAFSYQPESFPLRPGMKGDKIAQLQRYLKTQNFASLIDDGIWGKQTSAAFKASNLYAPARERIELSQDNYYAFQIDQL